MAYKNKNKQKSHVKSLHRDTKAKKNRIKQQQDAKAFIDDMRKDIFK